MGIRKPGELAAAVTKVQKNLHDYDTSDYPEDHSAYMVGVDQKAVRVVLEAVQPLIVADFIRAFVYTNSFEYPEQAGHLTDDAINAFLEGLDVLRGPRRREMDELRVQLRTAVVKKLELMKELPWSGDHLYGDAISDAMTVVVSEFEDLPFPVLERFRCPSLGVHSSGYTARCELQLPHEGMHKATDPLFKWADEESTNPPKAYDSDAEELSGHPVRRCPCTYQDLRGNAVSPKIQCDLEEGHGPVHVSAQDDTRWHNDYQGPGRCTAGRMTAGLVLSCGLPAGHDGEHQDDGSMMRWS